MGRGKDDPHLRSDLREKGEQLPVIAFDFGFLEGNVRLWRDRTEICHDTGCCGRRFVLRESHSPFLGKEANVYSATGLIKFIEGFFRKHETRRDDALSVGQPDKRLSVDPQQNNKTSIIQLWAIRSNVQ